MLEQKLDKASTKANQDELENFLSELHEASSLKSINAELVKTNVELVSK